MSHWRTRRQDNEHEADRRRAAMAWAALVILGLLLFVAMVGV